MEPQDFGPYSLIEQIAVGGMAQIYLAKTRGIAGFEKYLALKLLHPSYATDDQFINMLIDEAKIAVRLNHVNIAQVFDLGRFEDRYFISMEFIDGADLFKIMRRLTERDIDVPIDVAVYIAQELCTGLDYAHRQKDDHGRPLDIIHRDISPQNILISRAGEVKIVDFGIAKATSRTLATQAGVIKGKYFYMSPEQAWGDPVDQRSDIFSAGIILYEVLTGQMLYLEEEMHKLLDLVRKANIPPPTTRRPEIPRELEQIVLKALAKNPTERWQTAHDFQLALTHFLFSFAPDFTPDRLAALVIEAIADDDALEEPIATEPPIGALSAAQVRLHATEVGNDAPARDGTTSTQQVRVADLMSRADYRPDEEQSVIFRLGQLLDEDDADEDPGEATLVSSPPAAMLAPGLLTEIEDGWEEVAGDPTLVTRPRNEPTDLDTIDSIAEVIISPDRDGVDDPTLVEARAVNAQRMVRPPPKMASKPPPVPPVPPPPSAPASNPPGWPPSAPASNPPGWPPSAPASSPPGWSPAPAVTPRPNWPPIRQEPAAAAPAAAAPGLPAVLATNLPGRTSSLAQRAAASGAEGAPSQASLAPLMAAGPPGGWQDVAWVEPGGGDLGLTDLAGAWPPSNAHARRQRRVLLVVSTVGFLLLASLPAAAIFTFFSPEEPAMVQVISVPLGAEVWLDGKKAPRPTRVSIPVSDPTVPHKLEVRMLNYEDWTSTIRFPEGQRHVQALAVLNPVYGRLQVDSNPPGADVYFNSEHRGRTPTVVEGLPLTEEINLELRKRGFRPETRTIDWEGQRYRKLVITLTRSR